MLSKPSRSLLVVLFLIAFSGTAVRGQSLWKDTSCGMTTTELLKKYPSLRDMKPEEIAHFYPKDLRVPEDKDLVGGTSIFGQPCNVRFSFKQTKLFRVAIMFSPGELPAGKAEEFRDTILEGLRNKYGPADSFRRDTAQISDAAALVTIWKNNQTRIEANALVLSGNIWLTIIYSADDESEASKL